jgi:hypothetical protein
MSGLSMSVNRFHQVVMIIGLMGCVWPLMMLVHESGHVLGALATGGHVQRMVWYPLVLSRTDVSPNPSPLIVVWAGPGFGAIAPAVLAMGISALRWSISYLITFFGGFCLLANGTYIGVGTFERVGDAKDMLRLGTPPWVMLLFGLSTTIWGLWLINRVSPKLGFGKHPTVVRSDHAYGVLVFALVVLIVGFAIGNQGV